MELIFQILNVENDFMCYQDWICENDSNFCE